MVTTSVNYFSYRDGATKGRLLLSVIPLIIVVILAVFNPAALLATTVYSTGFEISEGYNSEFTLAGQAGWRGIGSGGNGLVVGEFPGQGQQGYIGFEAPAEGDNYLLVYQPINKTLPYVKFSVMFSIYDSSETNENYDNFFWSVYNQEGDELVSLDFDNYERKVYYYLDSTNSRVATGLEFANGVAYPLNLELDFMSNRWSATFNGALLATNQPITTLGSPLNLGDIDAGWVVFEPSAPGDNYMVFDNYLVTASLPSPQVRLFGLLGGAPVLRLSGIPDLVFAVDASTNLLNWVPLRTNVTMGGYFDCVDDEAIGMPRRFYRARWVP
ncbi:MAG TPA: hypothetical protein P5205_11895 [Candidatus Paceibacterota bacterium]|nr:hypothetical protein [Verrucomicrobiota bacterium]HSA11062.1 hypothetical protein [Candidatus Paceibacterota bacterium]